MKIIIKQIFKNKVFFVFVFLNIVIQISLLVWIKNIKIISLVSPKTLK